jgi:hypothetical protein
MPPSYIKNKVTVQTGANLDAQGTQLERFQVKAAAAIVNKAIACLGATHRQLKHGLRGDALRYSRRYFLFGANGPDAMQRNVMLSVLVLTWNGLRSERTIVIDEHGLNEGAMGWTSVVPVPADQITAVQAAQPERKTFYDAPTGGFVSVGQVNVSDALLQAETRQGVMTFLHEATHRYANTQDFDAKGYSTDGVTFNAPGLTTMEALQNAESYGWFAYKVGR